jgi:hypothetical protein
LTRNHRDFYAGPLIPIQKCFGIIALDAHNREERAIENMGAFIRALGPHVKWNWWDKTKIKFGPESCTLVRFEGKIVRRSLIIDGSRDAVWFR